MPKSEVTTLEPRTVGLISKLALSRIDSGLQDIEGLLPVADRLASYLDFFTNLDGGVIRDDVYEITKSQYAARLDGKPRFPPGKSFENWASENILKALAVVDNSHELIDAIRQIKVVLTTFQQQLTENETLYRESPEILYRLIRGVESELDTLFNRSREIVALLGRTIVDPTEDIPPSLIYEGLDRE